MDGNHRPAERPLRVRDFVAQTPSPETREQSLGLVIGIGRRRKHLGRQVDLLRLLLLLVGESIHVGE